MNKIILSTLLAGSLMLAAEIDVKKDEFITHAEFGYVNTQGNTDTTALSLDAKISKAFDKHIFELLFDGQYATDSNVESKNKYLLELTYNYQLTDRFAFAYLLGYKEDLFSNYDYQAYTGPGAKYKVIKTEEHKLQIEGNILYAQDKIKDIDYDSTGTRIAYPNPNNIAIASTVNGETRSYSAYRAKAVYAWQILENLKFSQELSYRSEFEDASNYFVFSKTAFVNKISNIFSAGVNYKVDYVNLAGAGKENTDRTFTANLILDF